MVIGRVRFRIRSLQLRLYLSCYVESGIRVEADSVIVGLK